MPFLELCEEIVAAVNTMAKKNATAFKRDYDPQWRVACLAGCGWFHPDALTDKGRAEINKMATELGLK